MNTITVTLTRGRELRRPRAQVRFRISSSAWNFGGNAKDLARSTEGYNNIGDAADAASLVIGAPVEAKLGKQVIQR